MKITNKTKKRIKKGVIESYLISHGTRMDWTNSSDKNVFILVLPDFVKEVIIK